MSDRYDVIVVGVGTFGSAAGAELAARGARVLGLDRFGTPNSQGAHDAGPRVFRVAYYEHPDYVPLLKRSQTLWRGWNELGESDIFHQVGAVYVGPKECELIAESARSGREHDVPVEMLGREELAQRYPAIGTDVDSVGLFEPTAGFVLARDAVARFADHARRRGAEIRTEHVQGVYSESSGVRVDTDSGSYIADRCVVTGGAWVGQLTPELNPLVTITRQIVGWCVPSDPSRFTVGVMPCWATQEPDDSLFYGFPILPGSNQMKIAIHGPGQRVDVEAAHREPKAEDAEEIRRLLTRRFPDENITLDRTEVCLYARFPDGHFIIDHAENDPRIIVACGFSGHGFKFAPVIAEALAELALQGQSNLPIEFLRLDRLKDRR